MEPWMESRPKANAAPTRPPSRRQGERDEHRPQVAVRLVGEVRVTRCLELSVGAMLVIVPPAGRGARPAGDMPDTSPARRCAVPAGPPSTVASFRRRIGRGSSGGRERGCAGSGERVRMAGVATSTEPPVRDGDEPDHRPTVGGSTRLDDRWPDHFAAAMFAFATLVAVVAVVPPWRDYFARATTSSPCSRSPSCRALFTPRSWLHGGGPETPVARRVVAPGALVADPAAACPDRLPDRRRAVGPGRRVGDRHRSSRHRRGARSSSGARTRAGQSLARDRRLPGRWGGHAVRRCVAGARFGDADDFAPAAHFVFDAMLHDLGRGHPPSGDGTAVGAAGSASLAQPSCHRRHILLFRAPKHTRTLDVADEARIRTLLRDFGDPDSLGYFATRRDKSTSGTPMIRPPRERASPTARSAR